MTTLTSKFGTEPSGSITLGTGGPDGDSKPILATDEESTLTRQFDDNEFTPKDDKDAPKTPEDDDSDTPKGEDGDGDDTDEGEGDEQNGDQDKAEGVKLTDEQVDEVVANITDPETGELSEDALTAEWEANAGKGLNDETYQVLADHYNVPKDMAKKIEASLMGQKAAEQDHPDYALFEAAGGSDQLGEALEWGKGKLDEKAKVRFNKVMEGKDQDAKVEAIQSLMYKYQASGPAPKADPVPKPKVRRDATKGGSRTNVKRKPKLEPFVNRQEWRDARKAANGNQEQLLLLSQRAGISNFS